MSFLHVKDKLIAEDIVQITINACQDYFRSWHYRKVQVTDLFSHNEKIVPHSVIATNVADHVLNLPLNYREVVILHYFDEQGTAEISQILNIPVGTVKTRLQKARQLLKGILLEEGGESYEQQA